MSSAAKKARTNTRRSFNNACKILQTETAKTPDVINITILPQLRDDIHDAYNNLSAAIDDFADELDPESDDYKKATEGYQDEVDQQYCTANSLFASFYKPPVLPQHTPSASASSLSPAQSLTSMSRVKCKTVEPPKFYGDVREYPVWKRRFETKFLGRYGSDAGVILKEIVLGDAAGKIKAIDDDDIQGMLHKLDKEYGRPQQLINTVISDVKSIPMCSDGDSQALRLMYNKLVQAQADLKYVNLEMELEHSSTVRIVEQRLSPTLQKDWAKVKFSLDVKTASALFPPLLEFLENEVLCAEDVRNMRGDDDPDVMELSASFAALPVNSKVDPSASQSQSAPYCTYHKSFGHWPRFCRGLRRQTTEDKVKWFETDGKAVCRICLNEGHGIGATLCTLAEKLPKCFKCDKKHHADFHDALEILRNKEPVGNPTPAYNCRTFSASINYRQALSPALVGRIPVQSGTTLNVGVLLDAGSVITLVSLRVVQLGNLKKASEDPFYIVLETVGGDMRKIKAYAYQIPLLSKSKGIELTHITGFGVDNIGSRFHSIDIGAAATELGITPSTVCYPSNLPLDILIGMDNAHICHPRPVETPKGRLGLLCGETDIGYVIFGSHPSFARSTPGGHYRVTSYGTKACSVDDLFATETMGVECSPKCGSCRCGKCAPGSGTLSLKDEREYKQIRDGMKLVDGVVIANYPWIKDPSTVPDHLRYCMKRLIQFENRMLTREPESTLTMFKEQFAKMLELGIYRILSKEEDESWQKDPNNPVHYLPYREVLKPSSQTTPLRIILDTASSPDGKSINDFWATGPKLIINPLGLQIRHREQRIAMANDINKMYNEVRTVEMVHHCHRILYRQFDQSRAPDTYVVVRNSFGSRPAGAVAIAALHLVAEEGQSQYPLGSKLITEQTYVDDLLDAVPDMTIAKETMVQTESCLSLGSFTVKDWTVIDGYNVPESTSDQDLANRPIGGTTETILGVHWELATDTFRFMPKINFSKKKRGIHTGPNLVINEIFDLPEPLTLRKILSQVNGFYDPLGLVAPYISELKFALGKLWKIMKTTGKDQKIIWDLDTPQDCDLEWRRLLNAAFHLESIRFPRVLKPQNAQGKPWLILMSDSSMRTFGACAYIRWQLVDGSYWCRLIAAKSRVWPTEPGDYLSLCRGELQGVVLGKRLAVTILNESRFEFERTLFILDSEIVCGQINRDSHAFDIFVGNRVGEIRSKFSPDQFFHVRSDQNPSADLLSRGTVDASKLDRNSCWQRGPPFLYEHFDSWEVSQEYTSSEPLPELREFKFNQKTMSCQPSVLNSESTNIEPHGDCTWTEALTAWKSFALDDAPPKRVRTLFPDDAESSIAERIDVSRYSTLNKLLGVTYRFLHALAWRPGNGHFATYMASLQIVNADQLDEALRFWIRDSQRILEPDIKAGKYRALNPVQDLNMRIWTLNGRFGDNPDGYHPIILPRDHPFVRLLVTSIHGRSHCGVTATAAKVKNEYHVLGIKRLARQVKKDCTMCRRITKELMKVPMAPYPTERFRPAFAFEHCSCDLFGPFLLQVPGKVTRGRPMQFYGKGFGLIITCLSTRAIHIEAMEGQDTSQFLMSLRRFMSIRGQPRYIWSDNGGQIVAADTELQNIIKDWNPTELRKFGANNGIRFQYAAPLAPWQNGVSESLIRSVKKSLAQSFNSKPRIPIMQLQTMFYEVAAILNERPINLGHEEVPDDWDSDTNVYLCPNQLLLGRSTVRIPSGPFGVAKSDHSELFHKVENHVNDWWQKWNTHYLPSLLRQSKWHDSSRPVAVGDIVFVRDSNAVRSQWQIAEITKLLISDKDSLVRNVELRYKNVPNEPLDRYSGTPDKVEIRDVKTLVILVTLEERKLDN